MTEIAKKQKKTDLRCVFPVHSVDSCGWAHTLIHISHQLVVGSRRVVPRMRPEVGSALHGRGCCRDATVVSPGRRGRRTPTRNNEAVGGMGVQKMFFL